jgi:hypothetical protein
MGCEKKRKKTLVIFLYILRLRIWRVELISFMVVIFLKNLISFTFYPSMLDYFKIELHNISWFSFYLGYFTHTIWDAEFSWLVWFALCFFFLSFFCIYFFKFYYSTLDLFWIKFSFFYVFVFYWLISVSWSNLLILLTYLSLMT